MARKEKTIHYIYKTTCLVTNRYYIGMHSTSKLDDGYMGSGKRLRRSIRKYGVENHIKEILEYCENINNLSNREKEIVTLELISDELCMNLVTGGYGGFISKEGCKKGGVTAMKNLIKRKNEDKVFYNNWLMKVSESNKRDMIERVKNGFGGDTFSGKIHSEKTKLKISEKAKQRIGDKNSSFGTCWITKEGVNKKIKKEDLENHLNDGWIKGRKI